MENIYVIISNTEGNFCIGSGEIILIAPKVALELEIAYPLVFV